MNLSDLLALCDHSEAGITEQLAKLIQKTGENAYKGKLVIEIEIDGKGERATVTVCSKLKLPEHGRASDVLYFDLANGALVREDPKQLNIPRIGGRGSRKK